MKISILDPVSEKPVYRDEFVVTATAGSSNGDEEQVLLGRFGNDKESKKKLKEMLRLCERMKDAYPQGRGGEDFYSIVPGYTELIEEIWPGDPMSDYEVEADFNGYVVFYYDSEGIKHAVGITNK